MTTEHEKALGWLVTDLEFRKSAERIIARLNRAKAKPENMRRNTEACRSAQIASVQARRRNSDIAAGIVRADAAQDAKNAGLEVADIV